MQEACFSAAGDLIGGNLSRGLTGVPGFEGHHCRQTKDKYKHRGADRPLVHLRPIHPQPLNPIHFGLPHTSKTAFTAIFAPALIMDNTNDGS
jgi:hypothetical protein